MCIITTLIIEFEFLVTQSVPLTPNHACMSERHFCGDQARLSDDFYAPVSPSIKHFKMVSLKFKPFKVITRVQFILRDSFQPLRKLFFFFIISCWHGFPPIRLSNRRLNRDSEQSTFSTQLNEKQKSAWEKCFLRGVTHAVPFARHKSGWNAGQWHKKKTQNIQLLLIGVSSFAL